MSERTKIWIRALRAPFLTVTIVPIALGAVIAWNEPGSFNRLNALLTLLGGICIHLGLNLSNDYFDHLSGNDEANTSPTPFSGGSRVIQDKLIPPYKILLASLVFFTLGGTLGLYLNRAVHGYFILGIGVTGVLIAVFYCAPPLSLGYRGFGEFLVCLGFGPLMVLGSYYVQKQNLSACALWASIPLGIFTALVLYVNEFPDYAADRAVNKKTAVVLLGRRKASALFPFILAGGYVLALSGIMTGFMPVYSLSILLTLPLAFSTAGTLKKNFDKIYELLPANAGMIKLHMSFGLLLIVGFILDKISKTWN